MAGRKVISISLDDESLAILDTVMYDFQTTNKSEAFRKLLLNYRENRELLKSKDSRSEKYVKLREERRYRQSHK